MRRAFTLIELLVVVALIGILSTLLLANFNAARQRSRDAQRKSDLRSVSTALRLYYNDEGSYPFDDSGLVGKILACDPGGVTVCPWGSPWIVGTTSYMSTLPEDPTPNLDYRYAHIDLDNYTIEACLENQSDDKCGGNDSWCPVSVGCIYTVLP